MEGLVSLGHVAAKHQLADIMTKPLTGIHHHFILSKLGVFHPPIYGAVLGLLVLVID